MWKGRLEYRNERGLSVGGFPQDCRKGEHVLFFGKADSAPIFRDVSGRQGIGGEEERGGVGLECAEVYSSDLVLT